MGGRTHIAKAPALSPLGSVLHGDAASWHIHLTFPWGQECLDPTISLSTLHSSHTLKLITGIVKSCGIFLGVVYDGSGDSPWSSQPRVSPVFKNRRYPWLRSLEGVHHDHSKGREV